ncbi:MAG: signal peptide peptidase SppA, partial [bacterium]|nr:signal peptide peptidase SppA [bacterium]
DLYDTYTSEILESRSALSDSVLTRLILHPERLVITGAEAVTLGLTDLTLDWGELRDRLSSGGEFHSVSPVRYARAPLPSAADEVAVVFAEGTIGYGSRDDNLWNNGDGVASENFVRQLRELREDDGVKTVVLRVNSPGGSALASDIILQELKRLKLKKPVVVSMGNVAASGGYYISCAASQIIAQPNTITGSIGVVSVIPSAQGLYEKLGARVETVEKGKWAQFFRLDRDFSPEHEAVLGEYMKGIYDEFLGHVGAGRGLSGEQLSAAADGRVWSGKQALDLGLVDELGGMEAALDKACELAEVERGRIRIEHYPKATGWMEFLMDRLDGAAFSWQVSLFETETDRDLHQAVQYLTDFYQRRDFVQTLMPLDIP